MNGSNVITNSNQTIDELTDYYPFGSLRIDQQDGTHNEKLKFTGHEYDSDTALTYANARYQNGQIGRWVSQDPLLFDITMDEKKFEERYSFKTYKILSDPQSLNFYSYVTNNPLAYTDPTGLAEIYIRQAGPLNSMNLDWKSQAGHTLIKVNDTYYGFQITPNEHSDVQTLTQDEFNDQYKGQTWNVADIGTKWDDKIVNEFNSLAQKGDTEAGTYRVLQRNCTEVAWDVLKKVGAFDHTILRQPKTIAPDQMLMQLKALRVAENVYKRLDRSYEPLIKAPIYKTINPANNK